ncbi:MAG: arsenate reductase ArsC [Micropruina glycogenica]|jgi:protein-tyrosine-phosphatase|nr:arsenate reductase ArsC [Propionibacteriaceae bacterium]
MASRHVLFVCTHNAGRSQMAAALLAHLGGPSFVVDSAGTAPADALNPAVVAAMLEVGIDLRDNEPTLLTPEALHEADLVITLGVDSAELPGSHYIDWDFPDPAGSRLETVRPIRDAIKARVLALIGELNSPAAA